MWGNGKVEYYWRMISGLYSYNYILTSLYTTNDIEACCTGSLLSVNTNSHISY